MRAKQFLPEINMSPTATKAGLGPTGVLVGIEYEMAMPNPFLGPKPDEKALSIDQITRFFRADPDNDFSSEDLWIEFHKFRDKTAKSRFGLAEFQDYVYTAKWPAASEEWTAVVQAEADPDSDSDKIEQQAFLNYFNWVKDSRELYDEALSWFVANAYLTAGVTQADWLNSLNIKMMSDVRSVFGVSWPNQTLTVPITEAWAKLADSLGEFLGAPVYYGTRYHQVSRRQAINHRAYIIEPDSSITSTPQGDETGIYNEYIGIEIISPPLPLNRALDDFNKIKEWAAKNECITNVSTGLHVNISIPEPDHPLDYVKLVLFAGDDYIQKIFNREANKYCKSAAQILKHTARNLYEVNTLKAITALRKGINDLATYLVYETEFDHYFSVNFRQYECYVEFRSPGDDWLQIPFKTIEETVYRYAYAMSIAHNPEKAQKEYFKKLYKLIQANDIFNPDDPIELFVKYNTGIIDRQTLKRELHLIKK
jgi:hypothetical protein